MFCSDCGKIIDDDALICPECGAATKKGILALKNQEKSQQSNELKEDPINPHSNSVKVDKKKMLLVAKVLGLVGSAVLLISLFGNYCSITAPLVGTIPVSMSNHLGKLMFVVFLLAGLSILSTLLKYSVLQTVTGSLTMVWAGYMIWEIQSRTSTSDTSGLVSVSFGIGLLLFILAACLILASGITNIVLAKKFKAHSAEEKENKHIRIEYIICICLIALVICGIAGIAIINAHGKATAKKTVNQFMNAAALYNVDTMKSYLSSDVNDRNGLMEAYNPDLLRDAFLSGLDVDISIFDSNGKAALNETFTLFGKNYIKKYDVTDVTKNSDGTYTVKASASIIDMSSVTEQIQQYSAFDFYLYIYYGEAEKMCSVLNDAIENAGSMDTEFTFVVKKVNGDYKISEIDFRDS